MSLVLEVKQLTKLYPPENKHTQPYLAVDGISFELQSGEILGMLGPNGAGKSTTISMLLGVLTPSGGEINYFGLNFNHHRSQILNHVTFASTYIKMPWRLTVWENLKIYSLMYGVEGQTFEKRAAKFLKYFEVWSQKDKTLNNLSAGQMTRVMLAKAFIPHPKIVLLDEPTASLDPEIAHQVRSFIKHQRLEYGTSILYTSHNMDEVSDVCDRVLFLKQGKIVASDTPEGLARTITSTRMRLLVQDGLKRIIQYAKVANLTHQVDGREIVIEIEEQDVSEFLAKLADQKITYSQISINQPTLEDYFLKHAKNTP